MALLSYQELEDSLNIDLSTPEGRTVADEQIEAITARVGTLVGYPLEQVEDTVYISDPDPVVYLPTAAPVYAAEGEINGVSAEVLNFATYDYEAVDAQYVKHNAPHNRVRFTCVLPAGFECLRVTFTSGWTSETLPKDLRDAMITWIGLRIQEIQNATTDEGNDAGALKKVQAGSYTEEYMATEVRKIGDEIPTEVLSTVMKYQRVVVI